MGVGAGHYMYNIVVKKFTFAISFPDEFLYKCLQHNLIGCTCTVYTRGTYWHIQGCIFSFLIIIWLTSCTPLQWKKTLSQF